MKSPTTLLKLLTGSPFPPLHRRPPAPQHVHFAADPRHLRADDWAAVLLRLDARRAAAAGVALRCAANGVVLAEGAVPAECLREVRSLEELPPEWRARMPNRERLERRDEA